MIKSETTEKKESNLLEGHRQIQESPRKPFKISKSVKSQTDQPSAVIDEAEEQQSLALYYELARKKLHA